MVAATPDDINKRPPRSGRVIREDNSLLNVADYLSRHSTPFNTLDAGDRSNLFEVKSIYGLSFRDVTTEEGSATVGHNGPAFTLDTTANGPDRALLETGEVGRYVPGLIAEPGIYFQTDDTSLSGNMVQRWGYFNENNGFFFGQDSTGIFVEIRSGGSSVSKIRQADWNLDTLDGSGGTSNPSGKTLDISQGHIYRMPFIWYGSGPVIFEVLIQQDGDSELVRVHEFARTDGSRLVENPNLPVSAEVDNNGTATAQSAEVSGRQFALLGDYDPQKRVSAETVTGVTVGTAGFTHLLSFRRKANVTNGAFFESTSVKLEGLDIITDQDLQILVVEDATLTSASFGALSNFNAAETSLEVDTAGTFDSGGEGIWEQIISGGGGNKTQFAQADPVSFDLIRRKPITVLASAIDSSATVDCTCRLREEW